MLANCVERRSCGGCTAFAICKVKVGHAGDDDAARLRDDSPLDRAACRFADRRQRRMAGRRAARTSLRPLAGKSTSAASSSRWPMKSWPRSPSCADRSACRSCSTNRSPAMIGRVVGDRAGRVRFVQHSPVEVRRLSGEPAFGGFRARQLDCGYQLGCHPGESGILSAAGRHWATSVANVRYLEGSYDRHLFRRLVTKEDITFGYGGRAPALADARAWALRSIQPFWRASLWPNTSSRWLNWLEPR